MPRKTHDYRPDPAVLATFPDISGNTVNGVGEAAMRQPSRFFWHPPEEQTHGALQRETSRRFDAIRSNHPAYYPNADRGPELVDTARLQEPGGGEHWTKAVKAFVLADEGDLVGIAPMQDTFIFDGYEVDEPRIVMIGVAHNYDKLKRAPSSAEDMDSFGDVMDQYNRAARVAARLTNFIRQRGYRATPHPGPRAKAVNMLPAAIEAGFGELGKHGSLINRYLGSGFRLSAVTTDMPLHRDYPDEFGADDFCLHCQVCADACPPAAIGDQKQLVRGVEKWYVDFDKCIPYFAENLGCAICIAVCPWTRPGVADNLLAKMARRRMRREAEDNDAAEG